MKLIHWRVKNFRSIENESASVDDLTVLIGKNNSGKSNFIDSFVEYAQLYDSTIPTGWVAENIYNRKTDRNITFNSIFRLSMEEHESFIKNLVSEYDLPEKFEEECIRSGYFNKIQQSIIISKSGVEKNVYSTNYNNKFIVIQFGFGESPSRVLTFDFSEFENIDKRLIRAPTLVSDLEEADVFSSENLDSNISRIQFNPLSRCMFDFLSSVEKVAAIRRPSHRSAVATANKLQQDAGNLTTVLHRACHRNHLIASHNPDRSLARSW